MQIRVTCAADIKAPAHLFAAEVLPEPLVGMQSLRNEMVERQTAAPATQLTCAEWGAEVRVCLVSNTQDTTRLNR